jgi:Ser/Thr protein kinase RdoA (MazF antagonist)
MTRPHDSATPDSVTLHPEHRPRVAHSILDARDLADWCTQRWSLGTCQDARLLAHGQNDWYAADVIDPLRGTDATTRVALRVVKHRARTQAQLRNELEWQRALAAWLAVTAPLAASDGALTASVAAPEGARPVCVYPWLDGCTLGVADLSVEVAREAGALLARLHTCPARLPADARRHDLAAKLAVLASALDAACESECERRIVSAARRVSGAALGQLGSLPQGSLHGDLHFGNLRRGTHDRQLWLLDFDDCGLGALAVDLTPFVWRNRCEDLDPVFDAAWLEGYESVRRLEPTESAALPALHVARALYLASVLARDRDRLGQVPGFDRPWRHYVELIERALARTA